VIAYQSWTYWVFRRRVSAAHIPEAHGFLPAIAAKVLVSKEPGASSQQSSDQSQPGD
jgi:cytochrome d ubiquinol oxidase subunit II